MTYEFTGTQLVLSFIILLIISSLTAIFAERRGRSPIVWFILALLFSLLAPLVLFLLPPLKNLDNSDTIAPPSPPKTQSLEEKNYLEGNKILEKDRLWFYLDDTHNQFGPISIIGLRELWNRGQLKLNSYVWTEGMEKWETVEQVPSLHQALTEMKEML